MRLPGPLLRIAALAAPLLAQDALGPREALETPRPNRHVLLGLFPEPLGPRRPALTLEAASQFLRPDREQSGDGRSFARVDAEEWTAMADLGMDLGPGRLGLRLRVVHRSGGIADRVFYNWHKVFGMPQGGREAAPMNRLDLRLVRDGRTVAELREARLQLLDTDVSYTLEGGDARQGWRAGGSLQLPTGRDHDFSGSGGLDLLAGAAGWTTAGDFRFHGQVERLHLGLPRNSAWRAALATRTLHRAWAGLGWQGGGRGLLSGLGLDLTVAYAQSPFALDLPRLDAPGWSQHWTLTHTTLPAWSLSLSEEAGSYLNPDLVLALRRRF